MTDTPQVLLAHHLKTLKLPTFLREYDKIARQCASEGVDHVRYLLRLAELELIDRERRMVERCIKAARFPVVKSLDSFDFKVIPSDHATSSGCPQAMSAHGLRRKVERLGKSSGRHRLAVAHRPNRPKTVQMHSY